MLFIFFRFDKSKDQNLPIVKFYIPSLHFFLIFLLPGKRNTPSLRISYLYLKSNRLTSLDSATFNGLVSLSTLTLGYNQLKEIDAGTFNGTTSLSELYLNNNQIQELNYLIFNGLSRLRILSLQNNQIRHIDSNVFQNLISKWNFFS